MLDKEMIETVQMPSKGLKRVPIKRKPRTLTHSSLQKSKATTRRTKTKKKKKTYADLKREWLVPDNGHTRFKGLRGIYWYWLSRDVRQKEWEKWNGECITCLVPLETWQEGQCGHILSSAFCGEFLRFNRMNLTIQHSKCNNPRFSPHAGVANAINIDKRHGSGYMDKLFFLRKTECKNPGQEEYRNLIRGLDSYKETVDNLQKDI